MITQDSLTATVPSESAAFIEAVRDHVLSRFDMPATYGLMLYGSVAEGLGNSMSDIDFLVVTADDETIPRFRQLSAYSNRRVEVFFRTRAELLAMAERGMQTSFDTESGFTLPTISELDNCRRIRFGLTLVPHPFLDEVQARLDGERLGQLIAQAYRAQAHMLFKRGLILEKLGDVAAAHGLLTRALEMAVNAWAAANGEHYVAEKFVSIKLDRIAQRGRSVERARSALAMAKTGCAKESTVPWSAQVRDCFSELELGAPVASDAEPVLQLADGVTYWTIGEGGYLSLAGVDLFYLSPGANEVWKLLSFGQPLPQALAGDVGAWERQVLALLHRYGLVRLVFPGERTGWVRAEGAVAVHGIITAKGIRLDAAVTAPVVRLPFSPQQLVGAGLTLLEHAQDFENAREDASGAYKAEQWGLLQSVIARMVKRAAAMLLASRGIYPLPEELTEAVARLDEIAAAPPELLARVRALQPVHVATAEDAHAAIESVEELRRSLPAELRESCLHDTYERGDAFFELMVRAAEWGAAAVKLRHRLAADEVTQLIVAFAEGRDVPRFKAEHLAEMLTWQRSFDIRGGPAT